jgi:hypothetical protein
MICEVDVPAFGKRGNYGECEDEINNISIMNIEKLEILIMIAQRHLDTV